MNNIIWLPVRNEYRNVWDALGLSPESREAQMKPLAAMGAISP